ncbi:MAG: hypothetical protein ACLQQ4_13445 [Bacteroidia bacterium]
MKTKATSNFYLIIFVSLLFTLTAMGQQGSLSDSGFTNKAEAKNLIVNGLKEGKWIEYYTFETKTLNSNPYKLGVHILTTDTNAPYYDLGVYKAGKLNGIVRYYQNKSNKYMFYHYFINGEIIEKR